MLWPMTDVATDVTSRLRARVRGQVLLPDDLGYDAARSPFNALASGRPAAIVRPVDTDDVAAAIRAGVEADLGIGVRCGGHSVAGHSAPEGGLLIDLSSWRGADVDPVTKTADALGGSRLMDLDAATAAYRLAAPSGTFVDTGITGLTLTGGISYLLPSEGFACDALIGAQVVTASGEILDVDEQHEPDLLWALRGGGGNFGVVTRLRYRLTEVPTIYGGWLRYRGDGVADVVRRAFELDGSAPDELSLQALTWHSEEARVGATIMVAWRGDPESGDRALGSLLDHSTMYERDLRPMTWLQMQAQNTPMPFGLRNYWKGHFVGDTPAALADAMVEAGRQATGDDFVLAELIHGKPHRIPAESAAFGGRRAMANVTAVAIWTDPAEDEAHVAWSRSTAAAVEPWSLRGGGYLNYAEADLSAARVAAAFEPATFARLRQVKRRYDPDNRFRFNGNIPPA
jgi:FAD/FMN-containing dehydrogenase